MAAYFRFDNKVRTVRVSKFPGYVRAAAVPAHILKKDYECVDVSAVRLFWTF